MKIGKLGSQDLDVKFWQVFKIYIGVQAITTVITLVAYLAILLILAFI